jgi:hypothetical protein
MISIMVRKTAVTETHFRPRGSLRPFLSSDELLLPVGEQDCRDPRKICENLIRSKERKR